MAKASPQLFPKQTINTLQIPYIQRKENPEIILEIANDICETAWDAARLNA